MPKRANPDEDEDEETKSNAKRVDSKPEDGSESESESESDSDPEVIEMMEDPDDDDEDGGDGDGDSGACFVAWLEEGATCLSVGELHFSSSDHNHNSEQDEDQDQDEEKNKPEEDSNAYCVVCQLRLLPPDEEQEEDEEEEAPLVYTFEGGFPFRVLPVEACVPIQLDPVLSDAEADAMVEQQQQQNDNDNDDDEVGLVIKTFALDAEVHQSLLEELVRSSSSSSSKEKNDEDDEEEDEPYTRVSPDWNFVSPATDRQVVDGVRSWWKAGEAKTGWDLSKIPDDCFTTAEMLGTNNDNEGGDPNNNNNNNNNVLLQLYRDLCARGFAPNAERETIEDRFEWRTSLCTYFAWAVPNEKALRTLAELNRPIVEIGAGTGYWAWLLSSKKYGANADAGADADTNVDVSAYDLADSQGGQKHRFRHPLVRDGSVEKAGANAAPGKNDEHDHEHEHDHHNDRRVLLVCWPDIVGDSSQDDADRGSFGAETLRAYKGDTVVHIGELQRTGVVTAAEGWGNPFPPGGSSSSAAVQEELESGFELEQTILLPNWPPYNSHMTVWVRKTKTKQK